MDSEKPYILVVDDDDRLRKLLSKFLSENGFAVSTACDAVEARAKLQSIEFDLIVLDWMMPGETGVEMARAIRQTRQTPILMLTAKGETEDRIEGLEAGVDDYLTKPFEPRELVLRAHSILRRAQAQAPAEPLAEVHMGGVVFDAARAELLQDGKPLRLTSIEAVLLSALAEHPGEVLSREDLSERTGTAGGGRAIDVQVTRLRRKIEPDPRLPRYLQTVRGQGYVLRPD